MAIQIAKPPTFGEWLKERRKALDLTQVELAQQISCAEVTLRKLESGAQRASKPMALRLAEVLDIAPEEQDAFVHFARGETAPARQPAPSARPRWFTQPRATNLPSQPTPLIGRAREIAALSKRILQDNQRLVTLTGAPGVGKTSLAIEVAREIAQHFGDGVCFVPLATVQEASLVPLVLCQSLRLQESGMTASERLKLYLSEKHLLLVLDNFEHLLSAAAWVAELLAACPWLNLLVTSRAPLRIRAERQLPIPPLTLADLIQLPGRDELERYPAIALFVERAQAAQPEFTLTTANMAAVAAICAHLDGLPLAIELVAARVRVLSPTMLLARLRGHLLLDGEELRDLSPRHQSLRQAIDWSYALLTLAEQRLLAWLGVFIGGFTLEIASEVCSHTSTRALDMVDGLTSLVDKNLVYKTDGLDDQPRYRMLETIHEYALERLAASGEGQVVRRRHADAFLQLAETADPHLRDAEQLHWLNVLEAEHDNLRASLTWFLGEEGDPLLGLQLVNALSYFWFLRAYYAEGSRWLDSALARAGDTAPAELCGWTVAHGSLLAIGLDDFPRGRRLGEEGLALAHTLNDNHLLMYVSYQLYHHYFCQNEHEQAIAIWREALAAAQSVDDRHMLLTLLCDCPESVEEMTLPEGELSEGELLAILRKPVDRRSMVLTLSRLAHQAEVQGEIKNAINFYKEGLVLASQLNDKRTMIFGMISLVDLYTIDGDYVQAEKCCREAIELALQVGTPGMTAMCFQQLGELAQETGKLLEALRLYRQGLSMVKNIGHNMFVKGCLTRMASLANEQEPSFDAIYSMTLLGAADSIWGAAGVSLQESDSAKLIAFRNSARSQLSDPVLAAAWAKGKAMSIDAAITYALS